MYTFLLNVLFGFVISILFYTCECDWYNFTNNCLLARVYTFSVQGPHVLAHTSLLRGDHQKQMSLTE